MKLFWTTLAALAILSVPAFLITPWWQTDFATFYVGAKLWPHGSGQLYSLAQAHAITRQFSDTGFWDFARPPIYAVLLTPLAWFPPHLAFLIWQLVNLGALMITVHLLWPKAGILAAAFLPVWVSVHYAQDTPLLLAAAALSVALMKREKYFAAGLVLALCTVKFHLVLLLPVFFLAHRLWRMAFGLAMGCAGMLAACFAIFGPNWLLDYYRCIIGFEKDMIAGLGTSESFAIMPRIPQIWGKAVFGVLIAVGCYFVCRKLRYSGAALAATLCFSLLAAPTHVLFYDLGLTLPAFLLWLKSESDRRARSPAVVPGRTEACDKCSATLAAPR